MHERLKQRLVGAAVLTSLAVIFVPMLFQAPPPDPGPAPGVIPPRPAGDFSSRIVPLDEARPEPAGARVRPVPEPEARVEPVPPAPLSLETPPERTSAQAEGAAAREATAAQPDSTPADAWVVQLASFAQADNATALRDRLRAKGYTAFIEPAPKEGGTVTRVLVGPELDRAKALRTVEVLAKEFELRGMVVRYPR